MVRGFCIGKHMTIIQASFFWQNDQPGGVGFTFGPPSFSPTELTIMFEGDVYKNYMRDSDNALGSNIVGSMIGQLAAIGQMKMMSIPISPRMTILAALNIMWLSQRGFIPNDEFNGFQFLGDISHLYKPEAKKAGSP